MNFNGHNMYLKPASWQDRDIIYNWANDEVTRRYSFNSDKIDYESHLKWFEKMLKNNKVKFFILKNENEAVGQIRIENKEDEYILSYSVDPKHRGKGYGSIMLKLIEKELTKELPEAKLVAFVKKENKPSIMLLEKLGYALSEETDICYKFDKIVVWGENLYEENCTNS